MVSVLLLALVAAGLTGWTFHRYWASQVTLRGLSVRPEAVVTSSPQPGQYAVTVRVTNPGPASVYVVSGLFSLRWQARTLAAASLDTIHLPLGPGAEGSFLLELDSNLDPATLPPAPTCPQDERWTLWADISLELSSRRGAFRATRVGGALP